MWSDQFPGTERCQYGFDGLRSQEPVQFHLLCAGLCPGRIPIRSPRARRGSALSASEKSGGEMSGAILQGTLLECSYFIVRASPMQAKYLHREDFEAG